jgi:hypothetical protein
LEQPVNSDVNIIGEKELLGQLRLHVPSDMKNKDSEILESSEKEMKTEEQILFSGFFSNPKGMFFYGGSIWYFY